MSFTIHALLTRHRETVKHRTKAAEMGTEGDLDTFRCEACDVEFQSTTLLRQHRRREKH